MEARDYIESGILELYIYGLLSDEEIAEVNKMAEEYQMVRDEIISIEKSVIALSSGFSPYLSADTFNKIREKLPLKSAQKRSGGGVSKFIGWAAALIFMAAAGYFFYELNEANTAVVNNETERTKLQDSIIQLETRNKYTEHALAIVRDAGTSVIYLGGQKVAPQAVAKVYWNRQTQAVNIDGIGLPPPPEGMVYQVWALKFRPLRPTSIGLLDDFDKNNRKIFAVDSTTDADAFGITLEPEGGSETPTMAQLYVIGKA